MTTENQQTAERIVDQWIADNRLTLSAHSRQVIIDAAIKAIPPTPGVFVLDLTTKADEAQRAVRYSVFIGEAGEA